MPGDLLVADASPSGATGAVIEVNPATGAQTPISIGGLFVDPHGWGRLHMYLILDSGPVGGGSGAPDGFPHLTATAMRTNRREPSTK